jgi:hypothetical protein
MGHEEGKGLGRYGQGIVAPINESIQKDRTGLGHQKKGHFDGKVESWNFNDDPVKAHEYPEWVSNEEACVPELETLISWKKIGKVINWVLKI